MSENILNAGAGVEARDSLPLGVRFISPWNPKHEPEQDPSEHLIQHEKHDRFRRLAMHALESRMPWLARLLEAEGAFVLAGVGVFYIAMPSRPRDWIEIPELSHCLLLTPWAELDETAH